MENKTLMQRINEFKGLETKEITKGYGLYASHSEKGYKFDAYIPNSDKVNQEFIMLTYENKNNQLVDKQNIQMLYRPIFGVDVGDIQTLENELDKLINQLPKLD